MGTSTVARTTSSFKPCRFFHRCFAYKTILPCKRRGVKTEHFTRRTTDAHFSRVSAHVPVAQDFWPTRVTLVQGHDEFVCLSPHFPKSSCRRMFHRNLLGLPDHPPAFPATLVTESSSTCADPRSGSLFGWIGWAESYHKLWAQRRDRYYQRVHSKKNNFTTDIDDVPTAVASVITETTEARQLTSPVFTQHSSTSLPSSRPAPLWPSSHSRASRRTSSRTLSSLRSFPHAPCWYRPRSLRYALGFCVNESSTAISAGTMRSWKFLIHHLVDPLYEAVRERSFSYMSLFNSGREFSSHSSHRCVDLLCLRV